MQKLICLISCFFLSAISVAQLPTKQYSFTHYTTGTGLISNQVSTVIQDDAGYIWLATTDGLQRFDGVRYKTFRHDANDPGSIPTNPVGQMLFDNNRNLWMMLDAGRVCFLNTKTLVFKEVIIKTKKTHLANTRGRILVKDEFGNVFLLVVGGEILTYSAKNNELSWQNNFIRIPDDWNVCSFAQQPGTHKYWISLAGGGLTIYNHSTGTLSTALNNIEKEPVLDQTKGLVSSVAFHFDKKGRAWFINWNPAVPLVYCFDLKSGMFIVNGLGFYSYLKGYHELFGFYEQQDGTVWVRGLPVLAQYVEDKKEFQLIENGYVIEQGISYSSITSIYEDREKNVWVSTDNNGLFRCNPSAQIFTNINHVNHITLKKSAGDAMSFIRTQWGTTWVGTWGDGMYEYDDHFNEIPFTMQEFGKKINPFAWCMIPSKDSNIIWISSQPGIYKINQHKKSYEYYNPPLLDNRTIRQIAEDKYGNLWLGMHNTGLFKWTAARGKENFNSGISKFASIPEGLVGKITIDSKGLIWVAAGVDGAYVIDPDNDSLVQHFSVSATGGNKLPEPTVSTIHEYNDSIILIATTTYVNVYNKRTKQISIVASPESISGYICALQRDKSGYVWLTTTNGLYRINLQKKILVNFTRADGIENEKFNQAASYLLPDGKILFGTTSNFVVFDPVKIKSNKAFPDVTITGFKIANKPYRVDSLLALKKIELDHKENSLVIEFSSLLYSNVSLIKYRMEGIDKDWIIADGNYQAIYSYLPPGDYYFNLKTINEDGEETDKSRILHIEINAPFWKTSWFYSLLILLIAALLFWLDRIRMKRKESIQNMRSELADNLHQEVNTALGHINILSEMSRLKADKDPAKSKEFIDQIYSNSQNMMIAMDDMLWALDPQNDSMSKLIDRMQEHIDSLRNSYAVKIFFEIDKKVELLKLNMQVRQNAFWFFKSGSTNIIRTGASDCYIHLGVEKSTLVYNFEFDSSHSDLQQLNNLLLRQELAQKLQDSNAVIDFILKESRSKLELIMPV